MATAYFRNDEDDDERYNDEGEFIPDIGALNRAEIFLDDRNAGNRTAGGRKNEVKNDKQKFKIFVNIVANAMVEQRVLDLNKNEINFILSQTDEVSLPEYKNPTAFVLGYWVSKKGQIDAKSLVRIKPELTKLDYPIRLYDVIRYARLWTTQLL